jgi:hypothetical protein
MSEPNASEDRSEKTQVGEHQMSVLQSVAGVKPNELFKRYEVQSPAEEDEGTEHTTEAENEEGGSAPEADQEGSPPPEGGEETPPEETSPLSLSEKDDEGYQYLKVGNVDIRLDADGNAMVRTKVNGEEGWIKDDIFLRGHQLNQANNLKAEELSAKEKELIELEKSLEFGEILSNRMFSDQQKPVDVDAVDDNDFFPEDTGDKRVDAEVKKMREENLALKQELIAKRDVEAKADQQKVFQGLSDSAHKEMVEWCETKNITPPTPQQLRNDIVIFSENNSMTWDKVAASPVAMIKLAKFSLAKSSKKTPVVEDGGSPPKSVPAGGKAAPPAKSGDVDKKLKLLKELAHEKGANAIEVTANLIAANREKEQLTREG